LPVTLVLALNPFTARVTRRGALSPQAAEAPL